MDYGSLIQQAWKITWRHRFLWVLGMFAASTMTTCTGSPFQYGFGGGGVPRGAPQPSTTPNAPFPPFDPGDFEALTGGLLRWITDNAGLIILFVLLGVLLGIIFLVVSLIAQGGIARATGELARNRAIGAGAAWRAGLHLFWRYLAFWLILIGLAVVIAIFVAIVAAIGIAIATLGDGPRNTVLVLGGILAVLAVIAIIVIGIPFSIVISYAQRAIGVDDVGPVVALRSGYRVLRAHLGTSLLVWLISLALAIAAGIGLVLVALAAILVLGIIGAIVYAGKALSTGFWIYVVIAAVAFLAVAWVAAGVANSFFWTYWTIAYLRLRGEGAQSPVTT